MSFDLLAPHYRGMELLLAGRVMQRCRVSFLSEARGCRRALLLGEGPGRFLVELLRVNPQVEVISVDKSSRMIHEARRQVIRGGLDAARVTFVHRDAVEWQPPTGAFDLVVTHFFLDCFQPEELTKLIGQVASRTTDDARWLLADFHQPTRGWQKWRARTALAIMYAFFRLTTGMSATRLTPHDGFLQSAGFRLVDQYSANFGLIRSDLWRRAPEEWTHPK